MSKPASEAEIEFTLRDLTERECLFVPSGRLALWLALRTWLRPGDRLLMSSLNDDVVLFVVLAAGLRPVMAPVSSSDGNIDLEAVPEETWHGLGGVLTTNLYGLPDQVVALRSRCTARGIPLIEDVAHAIQTEVEGQPLGTFGTASAFSLSKHVDGGGGGVLSFAEASRRPELVALLNQVMRHRTARQWVLGAVLPPAERLVVALRLVRPVRRARRVLRLVDRTAYRMPLRAEPLKVAVSGGAGLDLFDRWVRVDLRDYRVPPRRRQLRRMRRRLTDVTSERGRRVEGVQRLRSLDAAAPAVCEGAAQPLFRVPLLVEERDGVVAALERRGIGTGYVYDPPLDDFAGTFADPSPLPDTARWWARHVLPVDPLEVDRVLEALGANWRTMLTPANPPPLR